MSNLLSRIGAGGVLIAASTALILGVAVSSAIPAPIAGVASLTMAAGALILGLSEDGAGV
ncbi:hypothetical protein [Halocatena halophila]|uniref:hypothetical protein n=1 Tax=Halocatena halophila TaxID=2814576 RepID=UPI002ED55B61